MAAADLPPASITDKPQALTAEKKESSDSKSTIGARDPFHKIEPAPKQ